MIFKPLLTDDKTMHVSIWQLDCAYAHVNKRLSNSQTMTLAWGGTLRSLLMVDLTNSTIPSTADWQCTTSAGQRLLQPAPCAHYHFLADACNRRSILQLPFVRHPCSYRSCLCSVASHALPASPCQTSGCADHTFWRPQGDCSSTCG